MKRKDLSIGMEVAAQYGRAVPHAGAPYHRVTVVSLDDQYDSDTGLTGIVVVGSGGNHPAPARLNCIRSTWAEYEKVLAAQQAERDGRLAEESKRRQRRLRRMVKLDRKYRPLVERAKPLGIVLYHKNSTVQLADPERALAAAEGREPLPPLPERLAALGIDVDVHVTPPCVMLTPVQLERLLDLIEERRG